MKILYVGLARAVWLFDVSLLNPKGMSLQGVFDRLVGQYRFAQFPKNPLDFDEQRVLAFKSGTFVNSKGIPVIVSFSIYGDGLAAETLSSTDDSVEFLTEVAGWLRADFGLVVPKDIRRAFLGQIDCESEVVLSSLYPNLLEITKFLQKRYKPLDGRQRTFEITGIGAWTEDVNQPLAPAVFKFERKMGPPFSTKHYISQAPLETGDHVELLQLIEDLLRKT